MSKQDESFEQRNEDAHVLDYQAARDVLDIFIDLYVEALSRGGFKDKIDQFMQERDKLLDRAILEGLRRSASKSFWLTEERSIRALHALEVISKEAAEEHRELVRKVKSLQPFELTDEQLKHWPLDEIEFAIIDRKEPEITYQALRACGLTDADCEWVFETVKILEAEEKR